MQFGHNSIARQPSDEQADDFPLSFTEKTTEHHTRTSCSRRVSARIRAIRRDETPQANKRDEQQKTPGDEQQDAILVDKRLEACVLSDWYQRGASMNR